MFIYNKSDRSIEEKQNELVASGAGFATISSAILGLLMVLNQPGIESPQVKALPENIKEVVSTVKSTSESFISNIHKDQQFVKNTCLLENSNKQLNQAETIEKTEYICNSPDSDHKVLATISKNKVPFTYIRHIPVHNKVYLLHKNKFYTINPELSAGLIYTANMNKYDFNLENDLIKKSCGVSKYEEIPTYGLIDQSPKDKGKYVLTSMDIQVELVCLKENGSLTYKRLPKFNTFNYKIN